MREQIKNTVRRFPFVYDLLRKTYRSFVSDDESAITRQIRLVLQHKPLAFFVQVGSNDGVQGDPIHQLITANKDWSGMFIEPVDFLFKRLRANYKNDPRFIFENVAIGATRDTLRFYFVAEKAKTELGDALPNWYDKVGSFNRSHIVKYLGDKVESYIIEQPVECFPLQEVFDRNAVTSIDLIHIDTEGFDYTVLRQVDFRKYRPLAVLYEHLHLSPDEKEKAVALLRDAGYSLTEYPHDTLATLQRI